MKTPLPHLNYRPDLDGIRAIAVLLVVLFHLDVSWLPGGFLGVDMFFVLSGYLISGNIERLYSANNFCYRNFYLRRARRLLPALFATLLLTFFFSFFILTPIEFVNFTKSSIGATFSFSNIIFFLESGYWDADSELKPLLHTWSLSVEEQFYLIWPALFIFLLINKETLSLIYSLLLITILGLAACLIMSEINQSAAFYLSPFRIFQFSSGALILYISKSRGVKSFFSAAWKRDLAVLFGLLTLFSAAVTYSGSVPFPGWSIIPPTLATGLLILAGTNGVSGPIGQSILCNPLILKIGLVSYSMYLVHWPIIVLYRHSTDMDLLANEQFILAFVIFLAGFGLYYGVERAFYSRSPRSEAPGNQSSIAFLARLGAVATLLVTMASVATLTDGWHNKSSNPNSLSPDQIVEGKKARYPYYRRSCRLTNNNSGPYCDRSRPIQVLIIGDSHEVDGFNFLFGGYGQRKDINIITFGNFNECSDPSEGRKTWILSSESCRIRHSLLNSPKFLEKIDYIFYSTRNPYHLNKRIFVSIFESALDLNPAIRVVGLGPYLQTKTDCSTLINKTGTSLSCASAENLQSFGDFGTDTSLKSEFQQLLFLTIDRMQLLCGAPDDPLTCLTETPDGIPALYDRNHLSFAFAAYAGREFQKSKNDLFSN